MSAFSAKLAGKAAALRRSFRSQQRYVTTEDSTGRVWRHTELRNEDGSWAPSLTKPVLVNDPNYVPTWEKTEDDGTVTVQSGPYPTPRSLDHVIYASIGFVVLMVGVLIGSAV